MASGIWNFYVRNQSKYSYIYNANYISLIDICFNIWNQSRPSICNQHQTIKQ